MTIDAVSYARGSANSPYLGRIELEVLADERFIASYQHRTAKRLWHGALEPGTFARARDVLASAGFPEVPPLGELVPGESPRLLGWRSDGTWLTAKVRENAPAYTLFIVLTSTILTVLDSKLAGMPPGQTSPVIEHHLVEVGG